MLCAVERFNAVVEMSLDVPGPTVNVGLLLLTNIIIIIITY